MSNIKAHTVSCADADKFINGTASCLKCPFGDCLYSLKPNEKQVIFQYKQIKEAMEYYDRGVEVKEIAGLLFIKEYTVINWITRRKSITKRLSKYAPKELTHV